MIAVVLAGTFAVIGALVCAHLANAASAKAIMSTPAGLVRLLNQPPAPTDVVDRPYTAGLINPQSTRLLGAIHGATYYVALDLSGHNLFTMVVLDGEPNSSCSPAQVPVEGTLAGRGNPPNLVWIVTDQSTPPDSSWVKVGPDLYSNC